MTANEIPTPAYVVYEDRLRRNLTLISEVKRRAGVNIIMAFKANALWRSLAALDRFAASHEVSPALALALLAACSAPEAQIPAESTPTGEAVRIYPDYRDITIPPNIAPLNIQVKSAGEAFVGCIEGSSGRVLAAADDDGKNR